MSGNNERDFEFITINRHNWEEALKIRLKSNQKKFVPSVIESLAYAYIKPWDEAFDPYIIKYKGKIVGTFYLSYTPDSLDNYWIGGFQIDKKLQGKGIGKKAFLAIVEFIKNLHTHCKLISLTVDKSNTVAANLYTHCGFESEGQYNRDGEVIYRHEF